MKIAIIGSGISGLTCGYYLHRYHDITMFEANDYIGGTPQPSILSWRASHMRWIPDLLCITRERIPTLSK